MTQVPDIQETSEETKPKSRTGALIAAIGTVVTVTVLGVTGYNYISNRPSSVETLVVQEAASKVEEPLEEATEAANEEAAEDPLPLVGEPAGPPSGLRWLVPVTAPISGFPMDQKPGELGFNIGCSEAQLAWLHMNAVPEPDIRFNVRNEATSGGALSLGNIRFEGEEILADPMISFECRSDSGAGGGWEVIELSSDGQTAVDYYKGTPATMNVSPGEVLATAVIFTPDRPDSLGMYEGRLIADLLDGSGQSIVLVEDTTFWNTPVPGYSIQYGDGVLSCSDPSGNVVQPCSVDEMSAMLRNLATTSAQ